MPISAFIGFKLNLVLSFSPINFIIANAGVIDLHVVAGSVPGSYLGMDPAFLVWIPPLEDGDILKEMSEAGHVYEVNIHK